MIQSVLFMDLGDIYNASLSNKEFKEEVANFYKSNPHNNGWGTWFHVDAKPEESIYISNTYPLMNNYIMSQGAKDGEEVFLHSSW